MTTGRGLLVAGACLSTLAIATPAHADVLIGPRVSYYFDNSNLRTSSLSDDLAAVPEVDEEAQRELAQAFGGTPQVTSKPEGTGVVADQIAFPMIGAMINFGDDRDRVTITAMYGNGSGDLSQTFSESRLLEVPGESVLDVGTFNARGTIDTDRYDFEATVQRRSSENFAIFAGARYERLETTGPLVFDVASTQNIEDILDRARAINRGLPVPQTSSPPLVFSTMGRQSATLETFSARAGVTAFVPFGDNGVAFFNGMLHASYRPDYDVRLQIFDPNGQLIEDSADSTNGETSFGPDIAVGAQFILSENIALDVRYRAILFFPIAGDQSFSDARVNHGVNMGLSFRL